MHQSAIVLVRCVPGSSLLPPPYGKARRPWELGCKVMTSRHVPLDRRISDFWFLISDFRFPISDFWFLISDFRFPISGFGFRIRISAFWFPKSRFLISVFGNQKIPALNFWVLIHEIQKTDWPQSFLIVSFLILLRSLCVNILKQLFTSGSVNIVE